MTEAERQIALLLAQAQMDREAVPSNPSALASALTKHIPEDKPRFGRWQPEALASGETAKAGIVGKLLGALGLDASGNRAATSWSDAAKHTAGNVINAPQDIGNQLLDLQDYQPVYGTGASNPEDRARAGQQAVSTFGLAGLAPLGGVVAGRAARPMAGLQDGAGANPSAQLNQMLRGEGHTPGTVMLPKESFPVSEGNYSPIRGQWLEDPPGQDVAATRLDGSALYANSKEGALPGLIAGSNEGTPRAASRPSLDAQSASKEPWGLNDPTAAGLSLSSVDKFLTDAGVPFKKETSRSMSERFGPSLSTYYNVETPTGTRKIRISDHAYLEPEGGLDLRLGGNVDQAYASIMKLAGKDIPADVAERLRAVPAAPMTSAQQNKMAHWQARDFKAYHGMTDASKREWKDYRDNIENNLLFANAREGAVPGLLAQAGSDGLPSGPAVSQNTGMSKSVADNFRSAMARAKSVDDLMSTVDVIKASGLPADAVFRSAMADAKTVAELARMGHVIRQSGLEPDVVAGLNKDLRAATTAITEAPRGRPDTRPPAPNQEYTLYHGANSDLKPDQGAFRWFTTDKSHAGSFGDAVSEYKTSFRNPDYIDGKRLIKGGGYEADQRLFEYASKKFEAGHDAIFIKNWEGQGLVVLTKDGLKALKAPDEMQPVRDRLTKALTSD